MIPTMKPSWALFERKVKIQKMYEHILVNLPNWWRSNTADLLMKPRTTLQNYVKLICLPILYLPLFLIIPLFINFSLSLSLPINRSVVHLSFCHYLPPMCFPPNHISKYVKIKSHSPVPVATWRKAPHVASAQPGHLLLGTLAAATHTAPRWRCPSARSTPWPPWPGSMSSHGESLIWPWPNGKPLRFDHILS